MNIISHKASLATGIVAPATGIYTLIVSFNGQWKSVAEGFASCAPIVFPVSGLNENYTYICPVVRGPGGFRQELPPFKVVVEL